MRHTFRALAVARETGWNLDEYAEERGWTGVGIGPVGQHRDSRVLERANFRVIYADLRERFGEDRVHDPRFGHWAVGWVEELAWNAGDPDLYEAVQQWADALESYPVADETVFSEMEMNESIEAIPNLASSEITLDGVEYELRDDLPEDWAGNVWSQMVERGNGSDLDDWRWERVERVMIGLRYYVPAEEA